jgi:hypothetical protein
MPACSFDLSPSVLVMLLITMICLSICFSCYSDLLNSSTRVLVLANLMTSIPLLLNYSAIYWLRLWFPSIQYITLGDNPLGKSRSLGKARLKFLTYSYSSLRMRAKL